MGVFKNRPLFNSVVSRLKNADGHTYFIKIESERPVDLLRGLWKFCDERVGDLPNEYFFGELTDRQRLFRTTVSKSFARGSYVCIRTHGHSPRGDTQPLHAKVVEYLESIGIDVAEGR